MIGSGLGTWEGLGVPQATFPIRGHLTHINSTECSKSMRYDKRYEAKAGAQLLVNRACLCFLFPSQVYLGNWKLIIPSIWLISFEVQSPYYRTSLFLDV